MDLKTLTEINAPSGHEQAIRRFLLDELKKHYADKLFSIAITRNVRLSEAPSYRAPIQHYDKYAKGSSDYDKIAEELMKRI